MPEARSVKGGMAERKKKISGSTEEGAPPVTVARLFPWEGVRPATQAVLSEIRQALRLKGASVSDPVIDPECVPYLGEVDGIRVGTWELSIQPTYRRKSLYHRRWSGEFRITVRRSNTGLPKASFNTKGGKMGDRSSEVADSLLEFVEARSRLREKLRVQDTLASTHDDLVKKGRQVGASVTFSLEGDVRIYLTGLSVDRAYRVIELLNNEG